MTYRSSKLRPPFKTHGGKSYLCRRIIKLLPPHRVYVEPFAGGLSVLLNKPPSKVEIANDLDADLIHCYEAIVRDRGQFQEALRRLPYRRSTFAQAAHGRLPVTDELRRAATYVVRNRMSRGGLGRDFAWSDRLRGGRPGDENAWLSSVEGMPAIRDRLAEVRFLNRDAIDVIREHDGPDTLLYCDPPYVHATRASTSAYAHEMDDEAHAALLEQLTRCRGPVFLSGYHSELYDRELVGWRCVEWEVPLHAGQGKTKRSTVECLWIKPA